VSDVVFQNPYHRAGQASKLGDLDQEVGSHLQTLVIYKLVSNQSHYTSTLILLLKKVVLCSKFLGTWFQSKSLHVYFDIIIKKGRPV
jgi:hypothetical protein